MTDLMTRLQAASPASEGDRPPIGDVWRKVAAPENGCGAHRARRPWTAGMVPGAGRAGRAIVAIAVVSVPVILVGAIVLTMLGAGHQPPGPVAPASGGAPAHSTLDPRAQRVAVAQPAGRIGTVVALDPRRARSGRLSPAASAALGPRRCGPRPSSIGPARRSTLSPRSRGWIPAGHGANINSGPGGARQIRGHSSKRLGVWIRPRDPV